MERIYHPYWLWEDYLAGLYDNCSDNKQKKLYIKKILEMFNSEQETLRCMFYVVENWVYSMQHNLTNNSINKIAYIGQCACCYYCGVPQTITMEAWSLLSKDIQDRADKNALSAIDKWNDNNKFIQLCLKLD